MAPSPSSDPSPSTTAAPHQVGKQAISARDAKFAAFLAVLAPVSAIVPPRYWRSFCDTAAGLVHGLRGKRYAGNRARIRSIIGDRNPSIDVGAIVAKRTSFKLEGNLQIIRSVLLPGYRPPARLVGKEQIDAALGQGHGVILWVSDFLFSHLIVKSAICQAGYPIYHLSRTSHGFTQTRFGIRFLNPIKCSAENRHLAERIVIPSDGSTKPALQRMRDVLGENGVVSITVSHLARRVAHVPFFSGELKIATGPVKLAIDTGAVLLPVFIARQDSGEFEVFVEPPLVLDAQEDLGVAIERAVHDYAARLERHVLRDPGLWNSWLYSTRASQPASQASA